MAANHGGARPGAGRKRKADKFERQINAAEKRVADHLPALVDNMLRLANGGYERVEEKLELRELRDENGAVLRDEKGEHLCGMTLVERKISYADGDRAANQYLIDRILGRATERIEQDTKVSGQLDVTVSGVIEQVYGSEAEADSSPPIEPVG